MIRDRLRDFILSVRSTGNADTFRLTQLVWLLAIEVDDVTLEALMRGIVE